LKYNPFFDIFDNKGTELHGSLFGTAYGGINEPKHHNYGDCYVTVPCTLQEFYNGCVKTITYKKHALALDGRTQRSKNCEK